MSINEEAYKQAEKELLEKKDAEEKRKVEEVKGYILQTLERIEQKKKAKSRTEEELRVLKLDLDDLRNGKFKKIEERNKKSEVARGVSACVMNYPVVVTTDNWITLTGGTYRTGSGINYYF